MQASTSRRNTSKRNNSPSSYSSPERNKQFLLDRFLESIKSEVTKSGVVAYINAYMRYWHLYEEEEKESQEQDLLNHNGNNKKKNNSNIVYRYNWLINEDTQTLQDRIIQFVIHKKKEEGLGAKGIDNYLNPLQKFYLVNGIKGIDWELVRRYKPEDVKKTQDREYHAEEVIAIEEKLDVRGKVVSGVMRGSGVRRGAEPSINVGDLIPIQTKYGKIYKIWVYKGTSEMYATACVPEIAARIDAYFDYRMRFGETCKQFRKVDHMHEYHDGYGGDEEVIQKWFKSDEPHLDPDAPLIREDFNRTDSLAAKYPKRISYEQINDIIRSAAVAAGIRKVNKGEPFKRHKVMITHGFRKLFKKKCRQAKVDPIVLERLLGHKSGNPKDGITKLMMTYDPEDWAEMQAEFEKAIPNLTIAKDAIIQAELEKAKAQLRNAPAIEQIQAQQQSMQYQMERLEENMIAIFEKYAGEALKKAEPELTKIKDEKKRNAAQSQLLWDASAAAEAEFEEEEDDDDDEDWKKAQTAVSADDRLLNDVDFTSDFLDIEEEERAA